MNYFAHYYFDQKDQKPLYNFGLLLPDLLRNYSKNTYNKRILHYENSSEIFRGAQQHFLRDKLFHQHIFFERIQQNIYKSVKSTFEKYNIQRYWFGIHVIIELILDKYLIYNNLIFLDKFYKDIEYAITTDLNWLKIIEHNDPQTFINSMKRFCEFRFLNKYTEAGGTMIGLNKIYQFVKANGSDWTENTNLWAELLKLENIIYVEVSSNYYLLQEP